MGTESELSAAVSGDEHEANANARLEQAARQAASRFQLDTNVAASMGDKEGSLADPGRRSTFHCRCLNCCKSTLVRGVLQ
jgi:hypothetical protein